MNIPPAIRARAAQAPSPCYLYDVARLRRRLTMVESLPIADKSVFFATMANDHPSVLAAVRDAGAGAFVNSPRHLRLAVDLGFPPDRIVYAASNMTAEEMGLCLNTKVHLILDSVGQIEAFGRAGGRRCSVRINVGSTLSGRAFAVDPEYRFGILENDIPEALARAGRHGVHLVGAHCYFGTDVMDPGTLVQGLEVLCHAAAQLPDLELVDAGGGFGVPDRPGEPEFDLHAYGRGAAETMEALRRRLGRPVRLFIEPGRYLAADCGFFIVEVVDEKRRDDRIFIGTNASVTVFPRPLLYPESAVHHCEPLTGNERPREFLPVFICGNSTYSRDFLGRNLTLPRLSQGERLVFHNAGAYCRSMISNFLGKGRPAELFVDAAAGSEAVLPMAKPAE